MEFSNANRVYDLDFNCGAGEGGRGRIFILRAPKIRTTRIIDSLRERARRKFMKRFRFDSLDMYEFQQRSEC